MEHDPKQERRWLRRIGTSRLVLALCALALVLVSSMESLKYPQQRHFGDDAEYLLSTQSFVLHGSPDLRPGDATALRASLPARYRRSLPKRTGSERPGGYFPARAGKLFCWHFFTYPAFVAPIKAYVDKRGPGHGVQAFHLTNLLWFNLALLAMIQLWRWPRVWLLLVPLSFMTPALWFLPLMHTEAFVFALGMLAILCQLAERRLWAVGFAALAATQFQPIAVCAFALALDALIAWSRPRLSWRKLREHIWQVLGVCVLAAIALVPGAFYNCWFGTPSLVVREGFAARHLASIEKFCSLLFDLNTGMLVYLPGVLLLLAVCGLHVLYRSYQRRTLLLLLPWAALVVGLWGTTTARIWNYHTQGIARYALYLTPFMLLVIGLEVRALSRVRAGHVAVAVLALGLQVTVHESFGWFGYRGNANLDHNPIARYVLEHAPAWYSPPPEIFCSRTRQRRCWVDLETGYVSSEHLPAIFADARGRPVKALIRPCEPAATLLAFPFTADEAAIVRRAAEECRSGAPRYVNFR